jgi:cytochrome c biogenesis protein CcdA
MLAASLGNILVTAVIYVLSLGLYAITLGKILPQNSVVWAVGASFLISLIGSVLIYKKIIAKIRKKLDLDKWLGFSSKP